MCGYASHFFLQLCALKYARALLGHLVTTLPWPFSTLPCVYYAELHRIWRRNKQGLFPSSSPSLFPTTRAHDSAPHAFSLHKSRGPSHLLPTCPASFLYREKACTTLPLTTLPYQERRRSRSLFFVSWNASVSSPSQM